MLWRKNLHFTTWQVFEISNVQYPTHAKANFKTKCDSAARVKIDKNNLKQSALTNHFRSWVYFCVMLWIVTPTTSNTPHTHAHTCTHTHTHTHTHKHTSLRIDSTSAVAVESDDGRVTATFYGNKHTHIYFVNCTGKALLNVKNNKDFLTKISCAINKELWKWQIFMTKTQNDGWLFCTPQRPYEATYRTPCDAVALLNDLMTRHIGLPVTLLQSWTTLRGDSRAARKTAENRRHGGRRHAELRRIGPGGLKNKIVRAEFKDTTSYSTTVLILIFYGKVSSCAQSPLPGSFTAMICVWPLTNGHCTVHCFCVCWNQTTFTFHMLITGFTKR